MAKKKQAKLNKKDKTQHKPLVIIMAIAFLLVVSGMGFTHIGVSRYKDYTNFEPSWCNICHREPSSHDGQWITNHGTAALFNRDRCVTCHKPDSCKTCHKKKPASHDSSWITVTHIKNAEGGRKGCYECHPSDFCIKCHQALK